MVSPWGGVKMGSLRAADSRPYVRAPGASASMVSPWGGVKVGSLRAADSRPYVRAPRASAPTKQDVRFSRRGGYQPPARDNLHSTHAPGRRSETHVPRRAAGEPMAGPLRGDPSPVLLKTKNSKLILIPNKNKTIFAARIVPYCVGLLDHISPLCSSEPALSGAI